MIAYVFNASSRLLVAFGSQLHDAGVVGSVVYFGLAMVAELYPSGPTYQLALAAMLLYLHAFDDNHPSVRDKPWFTLFFKIVQLRRSMSWQWRRQVRLQY